MPRYVTQSIERQLVKFVCSNRKSVAHSFTNVNKSSVLHIMLENKKGDCLSQLIPDLSAIGQFSGGKHNLKEDCKMISFKS